jgi:hypothetical protein
MAVSKNASGLDPLGQRPQERTRRIDAIRARRYSEPPASDLNILLFALDETKRDLADKEAEIASMPVAI